MEAAEQYFSHLNPIAQRIANDIQNTKSTYGQLWYTLSQHHQNDIINDTLIKPEISLKYFNNYSSPCSSISLNLVDQSYHLPISPSNTTSMKTVVPENINKGLSNVYPNISKTGNDSSDMKNYYCYDGRNLRTFLFQKIAFKIIQDDTLGPYRDEHSLPFSYRTMSQMNLHLFNNVDEPSSSTLLTPNNDEICLLACTHNSLFLPNAYVDTMNVKNSYTELQNKLIVQRTNLDRTKNIVDSSVPNNIAHKTLNDKIIKISPAPEVISKSIVKNSILCYTKSENMTKNGRHPNLLKTYMDAEDTLPSTYGIYTDVYFDNKESATLMQNCSSGDVLTTSSGVPSDDDRDYIDEVSLCEDAKLLSDINLTKGFDFLNNW